MSSKGGSSSESKLITVKEAADFSSYTPAYLTRLAKSGDIEAQKEGRIWLIKAKSLEKYLDSIERRKALNRVRLRAERLSKLGAVEYSATWLFQKANLGVFDAKAALESLAIAGLSALIGLVAHGFVSTGASPEDLYQGVALVMGNFDQQAEFIGSSLADISSKIGSESLLAGVWSLFY